MHRRPLLLALASGMTLLLAFEGVLIVFGRLWRTAAALSFSLHCRVSNQHLRYD